MEKTLPITSTHYAAQPTVRQGASRLVVLVIISITLFVTWFSPPFARLDRAGSSSRQARAHRKSSASCHQVAALYPSHDDEKLKKAFDYLSTPEFQTASIARLSGAVQVKSESFDDLGEIDEDKRWDVFFDFHEYLRATFPRVHDQLKVEKVNTHGLLYTWQGSEEGKKPIVLMAHQDTVPVDRDTIDSWTYPPWSGHFDGTSVWGRGSSDCKNSLIGLLETLDGLLEAQYSPSRTIILSFGFDEESRGEQGAGHLAQYLLRRYGKDGIAAVVDEGMGYTHSFGRGFAVPGVAEKGYIDVDVVVRTRGGHSSIPPEHTSIGILGELITAIEAVHYPTYLADNNPFLKFLQCGADFAPQFPKDLRKLLSKRSDTCRRPDKDHDHLAQEAAKLGRDVKYLMETSQAVDIIKGGTKLNALPESATVSIDHRINIGDTAETVRNHLTDVAKPIAEKYNLTLHAFDGIDAGYNAISLSKIGNSLPVAPVTPTNVDKVTPYAILAGTVRALFGEDIIVAPELMTGNTDTRFYWDLTKHIFRFNPGLVDENEEGLGNIHTVDEHVTISNHLKLVRWFNLFIRNMDEADLEAAEY